MFLCCAMCISRGVYLAHLRSRTGSFSVWVLAGRHDYNPDRLGICLLHSLGRAVLREVRLALLVALLRFLLGRIPLLQRLVRKITTRCFETGGQLLRRPAEARRTAWKGSRRGGGSGHLEVGHNALANR